VPNLALIALGDSHHSQGSMKFATQISPLLNYMLIKLYSNSLISYAVYTLIKSIVYKTVMRPYALCLSIHIDSNSVVFYLVSFD
jgi:hypothetical protein